MKKHSVSRWIVLCFTGAFILSLAISSIANYMENRADVSHRAEKDADRLLEIVRIVLEDEENFREMASSPDSDTYRQVRESLRFLSGVFEAEKLSIYRIDPATQERKVILSVFPNAGTGPQSQAGAAARGVLADYPLQPVEEQWLAGAEYIKGSLHRNRVITLIMAGRGVSSATGYLVALNINLKLQDQAVLSSFLWDIIPIGLALLLGMVILLVLVRRRIITPIGMISDNMKKFAADSHRKPEPLRLKPKDEIGEIAASYTKMTEDISAYVNSIEALTKEKLETDVQLDVARRIQYGLVPGETYLEGDGFDACAMTHPARAVGGDFYDCFQRDDQGVCIVMGDVSGKGISAALFMAMAKTMVREKLMAGCSPATALNQANEELCGQNPEKLFVTAFAAVLNPRTGELDYANAGHTRPVTLGETPAIMTPDPGIALGLFTDADIRDYTLRLNPAEGILLYTDGVTEAVDTQNRFFGEGRLLDVIKSVPRGSDAGDILRRLRSEVIAFCDGREAFDDTAGLVLIFTPADYSRQAIPVALSSFDKVKETVFALAGNTPETRKALLACDEALANIVGYSGATELFFSCSKEENELRIAFSDNGVPFDPTQATAEEKEFEALEHGGMGISLIHQTVSGMDYERRQDRNEFVMRFPLSGSPE